jgi:ubiquitin-like protein Pup
MELRPRWAGAAERKVPTMAQDGGQQQRSSRKSGQSGETDEVRHADETTDRKDKLDEDVDAILDEIDEVLESNAEEFVRGFVQKGGQ